MEQRSETETAAAPSRAGVIMAGGAGERFWPLSRRLRPKQLLALTHPKKSMLAQAVSRLAPVVDPKHIYVVTGEQLIDPIRRACVGVPDANVIAEPCKRNTSGALAYVVARILADYGEAARTIDMAVTTADHLITNSDRFAEVAEAALEAAVAHDALATIGIVPTRPETGYGYIQTAGRPLPLPSGRANVPVYEVRAFHEKPNREQAEDFIASGLYFWNSGMFFWQIGTFLNELEAAQPILAQATLDMAEAVSAGEAARMRAIFEGLEDISIDYALMEHAKHVVMAQANFYWDDVGSWPALERALPHDAAGNVTVGDPLLLNCEECIIYNEAGQETIAVSVIGMDEVVVVVTRDAVLVAPKDCAQDVRHAVEELKRRNARQV